MFAVIRTGGKQYKVNVGDVIRVEKIDLEAGKSFSISDVLMLGDDKSTKIGAPFVANAVVKATLLEQDRNDKVLIYKKRRRKHYDRLNGHRQPVSVLHIEEILEGAKSLAKADKKPVKPSEAYKASLKDVVKSAPKAEKAVEAAPAEAKEAKPAAAKKSTSAEAKATKPAAAKTTSKKSKE